jgi:hypothetical protein
MPVNVTDSWAVPPEDAAITAEFVNITGVGAQLPPAAATPAGITVLPYSMLTATDPVPAMKNRTDG